MLEVKFFTPEEDGELSPSVAHEVDYVSLVNSESFGKPPLIAPDGQGRPVARPNDTVLYINTSVVPAFSIKRTDD